MRGELGGDIGQQPLPLEQPILQVRPHGCEAELANPRGDPLLGIASPLPGQPFGPWWQGDAQCGQRLGHGPLADAKLVGERGDAVPTIAAGLQETARTLLAYSSGRWGLLGVSPAC